MDKYRLVTIEKILKITEHLNADRLEIAQIQGWNCVIKKDTYKEGELIIYFAIDSILPIEIEEKIFGKDSKITLSKHRVKAIKIRGVISYGLIVPINLLFENNTYNINDDITNILNVKKHQPYVKQGNIMYVNKHKKIYDLDNFKKVRKPERINSYFGAFNGKECVITEKLHGTSFKAGWVKRANKTIRNKIFNFIFGKYVFAWRSMNVQLQGKETIFDQIKTKLGFEKKTYYGKDVYSKICKQYNLKKVLPMNYSITAEIVGDGIQKNYNYGCKNNEHKMAIFGVLCNDKNLPFNDAYNFSKKLNLPYVPVLYKGVFNENKLKECTIGKSVYHTETKIREGCVIETTDGSNLWFGKSLCKSINPAYEIKNQTEFH